METQARVSSRTASNGLWFQKADIASNCTLVANKSEGILRVHRCVSGAKRYESTHRRKTAQRFDHYIATWYIKNSRKSQNAEGSAEFSKIRKVPQSVALGAVFLKLLP